MSIIVEPTYIWGSLSLTHTHTGTHTCPCIHTHTHTHTHTHSQSQVYQSCSVTLHKAHGPNHSGFVSPVCPWGCGFKGSLSIWRAACVPGACWTPKTSSATSARTRFRQRSVIGPGLHLHAEDGDDAQAPRGEAQVPQHRPRRAGWDIRGEVRQRLPRACPAQRRHTLHLCYITVHYIALPYIILHYVPFHCITLCYITVRYIAVPYIILHDVPLHSITLHYTVRYIAVPYIIIHYVPLHCITLHYNLLHYCTLYCIISISIKFNAILFVLRFLQYKIVTKQLHKGP